MSYNKEENYCTLFPDSIDGVNHNYACYLHDRQYRNEVKQRKTRLQADRDMRDKVFSIYFSKGRPLLGLIVGWIMFIGVRVMGKFVWKK